MHYPVIAISNRALSPIFSATLQIHIEHLNANINLICLKALAGFCFFMGRINSGFVFFARGISRSGVFLREGLAIALFCVCRKDWLKLFFMRRIFFGKKKDWENYPV